MDSIQQRILEIALQLPEYVGYQAKERRREADKLVRRQLAGKYEQQRTRLARISRQAPLDYITELENLDQKLQRLIARLSTAPSGYAGWFDAGQIVESDLEQLTRFDAELAGGAGKLGATFDKIAGAIKATSSVQDAIGEAADLIDALNTQFDQREQFLSVGRQPTLDVAARSAVSPLDALKGKEAPSGAFAGLQTLKLRDAVEFANVDYVVAGKIVYNATGEAFWAFLLEDAGRTQWLHVGPGGHLFLSHEIDFASSSPLPDNLDVDGRSFAKQDSGTASVSVEGAGGTKRGSVTYALYGTPAGDRMWIEDFVSEKRTLRGQAVDPSEFKLYRR